ncbi:HTH_Tnp_Tc3_2 domain-containing protein [Trichonephila clavipes]|uniref:HTH_Tnp_Tc3_2 domain-containing protein n=1 Tax=Trichonephila clavipes TaxID=2585209 RepID=A0A8X6RZ54_TRICX|nr:HTH_Tnp_Tc3_2 domain-containing protein [Trichonephila clavipes]
MSRVRSRNASQHISDFDKGRIVAYRDCGSSYHSIAAQVGRDSMIVSKIWNRWFQDGNTECRDGSHQPPITSSREDKHVTRMAPHGSCSHVTSTESRIRVVYKTTMSARTVRQRFQQYGLSAWRPWLRLLLTLHHRQECHQWRNQQRTWVHEY